ncbi:16S rRNA (uracil(1498)-N(3))-methyltransferase [Clostridium sp. NSJ-49]|uniref:RsmE family RNA methyltransferase n=1 Tax=Clostridium sp. NSJ-49 TaxID=2763034 RepID=UPI00164AA97E|nr:RsmE family RNA methyltransferase [Clostridium sp. NSJ-49]MBC5624765.1 16S rRNA (uracil(1498)-N(3))-methyltransferase [Clostridium sp. NSJ-49]
MHKFFTAKELINENVGKIIGDDVKHIMKVLRLTSGEEVVLNNCEGTEYLATINSVNKQEVTLNIIKTIEGSNESDIKITLYQGLPKSQKMDLIVQKGTELGVYEFKPVITSRVDVKLKGEFKKLDRLNRISLEAAKQSKRSIVPKVLEPMDFNDVLEEIDTLDLMLVPYENAEGFGIKTLINNLRKDNINLRDIKTVGILVGPEGGFEEEEIVRLKDKGAHIITLGKRILRTETAGFVAASLIQYELSDLGGVI